MNANFQWKLYVRILGACTSERAKLSVVHSRVWKENPSGKKDCVADSANNRAKEIRLSFHYLNIINFVIKNTRYDKKLMKLLYEIDVSCKDNRIIP